MTATQYGLKYAVHLITSHFGNLVAKVCENLLKRGPLSLQLLIGCTELTRQQVKNSLLVLIQHNCVQPFSIVGTVKAIPVQYLALFDNILHRPRFPKFLAIVSQELDKDCEQLLEGLLQHGRLTQQQMIERAKSSGSQGDSAVQNGVQESFLKLVAARFVERCPAPELVLEEPTEQEAPSKKRVPKSAKIIEVPETIEQRVLAAATPMEAIRFSTMMDSETDASAGKSENDSSGMSVGEKRKHDASELDGEFGSNDQEIILWRANFEEFIRLLRNKACVENVRARLDEGAAVVLTAMLKATRTAEKKVKISNSVPLPFDTIYEEVINSEVGRSYTSDRVEASLSLLGGSPLVRVDQDDSYSVDLKKIIEMAQSDEVESIVLKRYGMDAYRMFRLLSNSSRQIETDKISDMTLVEKKETPKILYKLWKDEYLHMEKLVVTGAKQSQFLLWKVDKLIVWNHVLDEMYHAALNLSRRLALEREKAKELLATPIQNRTGAQEKPWNRYKNIVILMEASLLKLDDALMLFHDF